MPARDAPGFDGRGLAPNLLFVYGSLKRGFRHHAELRDAKFERLARTSPRYRLVRVADYPVLIRDGTERVSGELFTVSEALLRELDRFEGPSYRRAAVVLDDGIEAVAYVGDASELSKHPSVPAGEWETDLDLP